MTTDAARPVPPVPPGPPARANALGLVVADLEASVAFYRRCGVAFPSDAAGPHVEAELVPGFRLMLDSEEVARSLDPSWTRAVGGGVFALAFECEDAAAVDTLHAALVAAGSASTLAPFDAPWGQRYASVADPDGNGVDLYAALPA